MKYSVSELLAATTCEYAAVRGIELKLGLRRPDCGFLGAQECELADCPDHSQDDMLDRLAQLGDAHEQAMLARFVEQYGLWEPGKNGGVYRADRVDWAQREATTAQAFSDGADVMFQVDIADGDLIGRADFVVKQPGGEYAIYDTKLARSARSSAVLQITAYSQALENAGHRMSRYGYLALGSGETTRHSVADTAPVYRRLRARYESLVASRAGAPLAQWGAPELGGSGLSTCGRCAECERQLAGARDVLLVMGCTTAHRAKLFAAGIYTVEQLADLAQVPQPGELLSLPRGFAAERGIEISNATLAKLIAQAQLFIEGEQRNELLYRVVDTKPFGLLKPPTEHDIFFDFEGDPLYAEPGSNEWGLEYLWGWTTRTTDASGRYHYNGVWAHNRAEEKRVFEEFIDYLTARLAEQPYMHVYHYAPYETTALKRLALRHGTREEELDFLLRRGVFIDLYAVVRGALRTSGRSLSIKKLEPFYLDQLGQARAGVTNAADSITEYAAAMELRAAGDLPGFEQKLDQLADYNRYDCESTFHLLEWIGAIAEQNGVNWRENSARDLFEAAEELAGELDREENPREVIARRLRVHVDRLSEQWAHDISEAEAKGLPDVPEPDARLIARMTWAGIDYNKRENKQFWWAHFARLSDPVDEWTGSDIFRPTRVEVVEDWHVPARARTHQRVVRLYGEQEPGSKLRAGVEAFTIYDEPVPIGLNTSSNGIRGWGGATIEDVEEVPGQVGYLAVTIRERIKKDLAPWMEVPMGLGPGAPISTASIDARLLDLATEVLKALDANPLEPDFGNSARIQLLRRLGTVARADSAATHEGGERVSDILASLRSVDAGVVAVQGPPGAGKTFVASHVIATLAKAGWHIGVVAQSHAVVENVLHAVLDKGLPKDQIGKKPGRKLEPDEDWAFTDISLKENAGFFDSPTGTVAGGTAWTFSAADFGPSEGFDLIVIDEAGQYSMANSLAVTHRAARVLLLGDPQQLPQVSQGSHPEPINESALAWLVGEDPTISEERGFFLNQTWRMHPDLTKAVSELSYEGKLHSVPVTAERFIGGLEPGVHTLLVEHCGNTVSSVEEAQAIVAIIQSLAGKPWRQDLSKPERELRAADFIVVAPYNAQVQLLREELDRAKLVDTNVGTVDKFQGQEAPVALVSLAVSDADNSPRGLEFVRNRNRLNVSISRGKHSAFLVHSPALLDAVDMGVKGMEEHGAFIRLSESGTRI